MTHKQRAVGNLTLIASKPAGPDLDVGEAWMAELSDVGRQFPGRSPSAGWWLPSQSHLAGGPQRAVFALKSGVE